MAESKYEPLTHIAVDDIITKPEVADLLGCRPQYVSVMVDRGQDGIPRPVKTTRQGMIFSRAQIVHWARQTGRLKDEAVAE